MQRRTLLLTVLVLLGLLMLSRRATVGAAPDSPPALPAAFGIDDFDVAGVKLFTRRTECYLTPPGRAAEASTAEYYWDYIERRPAEGGYSRGLWEQQTSNSCANPGVLAINSNIVADDQYVYFTTPSGLLRIPVTANAGDSAELVSANVTGPAELALLGGDLWVLNLAGGFGAIWRVNRSTLVDQFVLLVNANARALSAVTSGLGLSGKTYIIWQEGGTVMRYNATNGGTDVIGLNVRDYTAEGNIITCSGFSCTTTSYVFMSTGTQVYRFNNGNGQTIINYDTLDGNAIVGKLVADGTHLFLFETYTDPCGDLICNTSITLRRRGRDAAGGSDILWIAAGPILQFKQHGDNLFWRDDDDTVWRLPKAADVLAPVNLRVTGMRVVQSIYDQNRPVPLIERKRTFVRVLVRSDGAAVPNVSAVLRRAGDSRQLLPVNAGGPRITVQAAPDIRTLEHSILFELPWEWTTGSTTLTAELNPQRAVYEPTYGDNVASVPVSFVPSAVLPLQMFAVSYDWGGKSYAPRPREDVQAIYSWLLRVYPVGGALGVNLRPTLQTLDGGAVLGAQVMQVAQECQLVYANPADRSLCASFFINGRLNSIRALLLIGDSSSFYYGMISDAAGGFPRGQAMYWRTSVGPVGTPGANSWDTDTTYGDWYAGHEIAHTFGRAHPSWGNACGHSASDSAYPYVLAAIGPLDGTVEGFDAGDPALNIPSALLGDNVWRDMMSYCDNQWISAYTYNGIYQQMVAAQRVPHSAPQLGDWLVVSGGINPTAPAAFFADVRAAAGVANVPPIEAGGYLIRQLDGGGNGLQDDPFTPDGDEDETQLSFFQVVGLADGARALQIVRVSDDRVLAERAISAKAPTVDSVALTGAPDPVSCVVTLSWQAQDGDGDALLFDIHYSHDGGATFQPLKLALSEMQADIDSDALAGSAQAIFRVEAHDGVYSASADSPAYALAHKPPTVQILNPADGMQIEYGQLVNFSGAAIDLLDQFVADANLAWYDDAGNLLGTGAQFSSDTLRVGANHVTLAATNSAGLTAQAGVTVYVSDNLTAPTVPTLFVAPATVGWHVAVGSAETQYATLVIGNAGLGALGWTATSDRPWLTLDAGGGTIPAGDDSAALGVQADPVGLANGATHIAHVTITDSASRATQVVRVSLSVGQTWPIVAPAVPTAVTIAQTAAMAQPRLFAGLAGAFALLLAVVSVNVVGLAHRKSVTRRNVYN